MPVQSELSLHRSPFFPFSRFLRSSVLSPLSNPDQSRASLESANISNILILQSREFQKSANMPRNRSAGRPSPRPTSRSYNSPPPAKVNQAPPPAIPQQSSGGSMLGGLASTIAQGMAFGTGSAVAHRAVDAVVGPRTIQHEHTQVSDGQGNVSQAQTTTLSRDSCANQTKAFQDCIQSNNSDIGKCQFYVDMLNECRRSSSSMTL